jgi:hypothetical protein
MQADAFNTARIGRADISVITIKHTFTRLNDLNDAVSWHISI